MILYMLGNVLNYFNSAKSTLNKDQIITNALAFYSSDVIQRSKDNIFSLVKLRPVKMKICSSHPNPSMADLKDIMSVFDKVESDDIDVRLPSFVSSGIMDMPPSAGLEALASVMCSLRDEMAACRLQLEEMKEITEKDMKSLDNVGCVFQDTSEIKLLIHNILRKIDAPPPSINLTGINQLRTANSTNESTDSVSNAIINSDDCDTTDNNTRENNVNGSVDHSYAEMASETAPPSTDGQDFTVANSNQRNNGRRRSQRAGASQTGTQTPNGNNNSPQASHRIPPRPSNGAPSRRRNVLGSGAANPGLSTAPRVLDIFVGGCNNTATEENLKNFVSSKGINCLKCSILPSKSEWRKCFKITVNANERDQLLEANFWPQGITVGKYFKPINNNC